MVVVGSALVFGLSVGVFLVHPQSAYNYSLAVNPTGEQKLSLQYGVWPALSNADYFSRVHTDLVAQQASFVEADLTAMNMRVYLAGVEKLQVPIKSKGKEGSWWETPSGLYRAEGKEKNHYSSFGHVNMPFSIPFQGNFFIHGWPYYDDGTPVSSSYSGGCIRLEDVYAEQVYELVEVGMPILVYEAAGTSTPFAYSLAVPAIAASHYLVADIENNFVLLAGGPSEAVETNTVSKLMAAVVASEHQNIEKMVPVGSALAAEFPSGRLVGGESYSIYDLLFPLLIEDSDEAAFALGEYFGKGRFVGLMEKKAASLGLIETTFDNPAGRGRGNTTTAEDAFLLLKYLYSNRQFILAMSANMTNTATYGETSFSNLKPVHPLVGDPAFVGGAAQRLQEIRSAAEPSVDDAEASVILAFASSTEVRGAQKSRGHDQISIVRMSFQGEERPIAFIVFGSSNPARDTAAMRSFVENLYR